MPSYDIVNPDPAALVESLRAFGYTTSTAIADLIDNSITAKAKNVWATFYWDGPNSWIRIDDDGVGMNEDGLISAMRPGSRSPRDEREPQDLGRFGLGLKSASFSQCRLLTVRTRAQGKVAERAWDLDEVERTSEWRLQWYLRDHTERALDKVAPGVSTTVLWEQMDRVVDARPVEDRRAQEQFLALQAEVEDHLAMTFHRFMQRKTRPLRIWMNGQQVEPWDPFLVGESATQTLPIDPVSYRGLRIPIQPYVLPHHSRIDKPTHQRASGPRGWNAHQGFYVYRNQRLLLPGDWLGLPFQKEEHYKLARIQVDLPNSMDDAWHIDVKKAVARPPGALKPDLARIAKATRELAAGIYRHRGKQIGRRQQGGYALVWQQRVTRDKVHYRINRDHPLVHQVRESAVSGDTVDALLRLVEETVPTTLITMSQNESESTQANAFETAPSDVVNVLREVYAAMVKTGHSSREAIERLAAMEPFGRYPDAVAGLADAMEGTR
ncbi:MAG: ATP-binding protein [Candidatus Limnocylindria bacterium]